MWRTGFEEKDILQFLAIIFKGSANKAEWVCGKAVAISHYCQVISFVHGPWLRWMARSKSSLFECLGEGEWESMRGKSSVPHGWDRTALYSLHCLPAMINMVVSLGRNDGSMGSIAESQFQHAWFDSELRFLCVLPRFSSFLVRPENWIGYAVKPRCECIQ